MVVELWVMVDCPKAIYLASCSFAYMKDFTAYHVFAKNVVPAGKRYPLYSSSVFISKLGFQHLIGWKA